MIEISVPTAHQIIELNKFICKESGSSHHCYDSGKIESAIHTALYPGSYPFAAGGLAKVAATLCFYIVKGHPFMDGNKRTGTLAAIIFLNENGWDLKYPVNKKKGINALASTIEKCAAGKIGKEDLMKWFENHKIKLTQ